MLPRSPGKKAPAFEWDFRWDCSFLCALPGPPLPGDHGDWTIWVTTKSCRRGKKSRNIRKQCSKTEFYTSVISLDKILTSCEGTLQQQQPRVDEQNKLGGTRSHSLHLTKRLHFLCTRHSQRVLIRPKLTLVLSKLKQLCTQNITKTFQAYWTKYKSPCMQKRP